MEASLEFPIYFLKIYIIRMKIPSLRQRKTYLTLARFLVVTDIEQVKNEKKSFTFRWMLRQITIED